MQIFCLQEVFCGERSCYVAEIKFGKLVKFEFYRQSIHWKKQFKWGMLCLRLRWLCRWRWKKFVLKKTSHFLGSLMKTILKTLKKVQKNWFKTLNHGTHYTEHMDSKTKLMVKICILLQIQFLILFKNMVVSLVSFPPWCLMSTTVIYTIMWGPLNGRIPLM